MAMTKTGIINGAAIAGFTTPAFTLTSDIAPMGSITSYVSAITGAPSVALHSYTTPFTLTVKRPNSFRTFATAILNGVTGQYSRVPYNEFEQLTRKGAAFAFNQYAVNEKRTRYRIYANTDVFDVANVKALVSFDAGYATANADNYLTLFSTGSL